MGHLGKVGDFVIAAAALAQGHGELRLGPLLREERRLDDAAKADELELLVGDFDADERLARYRRFDADTRRGKGEREVLVQVGDGVDLDARPRGLLPAHDGPAMFVQELLAVGVLDPDFLEPAHPTGLDAELGHGGAGVYLDDLGLDVVAGEGVFDGAGLRFVVDAGGAHDGGVIEELDGGQAPVAGGLAEVGRGVGGGGGCRRDLLGPIHFVEIVEVFLVFEIIHVVEETNAVEVVVFVFEGVHLVEQVLHVGDEGVGVTLSTGVGGLLVGVVASRVVLARVWLARVCTRVVTIEVSGR